MFIPLIKADVSQRLVYGSIDETPDRAGEVFDYATSKPLFEAWSAELAKASGGKSLGNVRAMHGMVAAGKLVDLQFDDPAKRIDVVARIVDDGEWAKIEEGVYTGFSPGGKYGRRWRDGGNLRYTAQPRELSLVDLPAIPTATFTLVKGDGLSEVRSFRAGADLAKGLYEVSRLTDLINSLIYLAQGAAQEAGTEQDGSAIPARLRDWLATGTLILSDMVREESAEALATLSTLITKLPAPAEAADLAQAAATDDLAKRGARNSQADLEKLQAIHDHAVHLGARCDVGKAAGADDDLAKVAGDLASGRGELAKVAGERDDLATRVAALEALPAPGGPAVRAVDKTGDGLPGPASPGVALTGSFEGDLAKIADMSPGKAKGDALVKLARSHPLHGAP